ncbi:hypothetical protein LTS09_014483 [Friedmanniomyces endolithicus]|nr:hypothetical protein LTS09_014483 [Friedmanniomyces endolithicus]
MLPPVESSVLVTNPKFEVLYRDLCANKLDKNGTSKLDVKSQKERDAPRLLRELVALAAAILGGEVSNEDRELVNAELESFNVRSKMSGTLSIYEYRLIVHVQTRTTAIGTAISKRWNEDASTLRQLLGIEAHRAATSIPQTIQNLKMSTSKSQLQLDHSRLALAGNIDHFHALHRQILESSIRILEQTIHGSVARSAKAKTEYLATVAEGMEKKVGLQHAQLIQQFYTPDVQAALRNQADSMRKESAVLKMKVRDAEGKLKEYQAAKGMQGMAKQYAEITRASKTVKEEIARL